MSLRIQNDPPAGIAAPEVGRSGQSSSVSSGSGKTRSASGAEGGDHVEVSSAAETISAGISAQNAAHAARVTRLSALYAGGQYTVDSSQVSRALVDNAVTAPSSGGNPAAGKA
jgi:anti-sigma28 factor (negative regulator of flagellin synthesis)